MAAIWAARAASPGLGDLDPGARPATFVALGQRDEPFAGEHLQVPSEVPVGQLQERLEIREVGSPALREDGEDPEPGPLVDNVGERRRRVDRLALARRGVRVGPVHVDAVSRRRAYRPAPIRATPRVA